jgi:hypothetical protein
VHQLPFADITKKAVAGALGLDLGRLRTERAYKDTFMRQRSDYSNKLKDQEGIVGPISCGSLFEWLFDE